MREFDSLAAEISALPCTRLLFDEPMSAHTSFRIGGEARLFIIPESEDALQAVLKILASRGERALILGRGTNLLVADEGIDGAVIALGEGLSYCEREGNLLRAGAGISLSRLAAFACEQGLSGLEFAHGIPGSLGGGVYMNAGAYGGELRDVIRSVRYIDEDGELREAAGAALGFSYRHSAFSDTGRVILSATVELSPGEPQEIRDKMRELAERRRASQPLDLPSAGSTFKRPKDGFAAKLIDEAGLKGASVGGAQVSEKHAGFVVNRGGASCADVLALMELVKTKVYETSGVILEPEVKIIK